MEKFPIINIGSHDSMSRQLLILDAIVISDYRKHSCDCIGELASLLTTVFSIKAPIHQWRIFDVFVRE